MSVIAIVIAGVGVATAVAGTTMGAVKGSQASSQARGAMAMDNGMRVLEQEEGLADAMFASIEQGSEASMQAGQQAISFMLQALGPIGVRS